MKTYELTCIVSSEANSEQAATIVKDIEAFIQSKAGVILSSQTGAAQSLAYPIKKIASGYFTTIIFQAEEAVIKEVKATLDAKKEVLRSVILIKRPVKEMKARRTRKPVGLGVGLQGEPAFAKSSGEAKKVNEKDLDKKLDEMLQ